jgi:hypothetical protein
VGPFAAVGLGGVETWERTAANLLPHLSGASELRGLERHVPPPAVLAEAAARRDEALARELLAERAAYEASRPPSTQTT